MNGRAVTAVIGVLTVGLGVVGLWSPASVMQWVGFGLPQAMPHLPNPALVETRAMYGGLFLVLGLFTLWTATGPRAHRAELLLIACLWLGIFGGRMVGVAIEGSPGLLNTLGAVFEFIVGCLLLAAPYLGGREEEEPVVPPA